MPSVFAIVSKKVFEKECGGAKPGAIYATSTYASSHKALDVLGADDALFLATVRPGQASGEDLWLVAVLERPKKSVAGWQSAPNAVPITDISALRSAIRFASGSGITTKAGALAMSLQTPRSLTDDDVRAIRAVVDGAPAAVVVTAKSASPEGPSRPRASEDAVASDDANASTSNGAAVCDSASPADRHSASPTARHSANPVARDSASPTARNSASPAANHSPSPVARHSASPAARDSASPAARDSANASNGAVAPQDARTTAATLATSADEPRAVATSSGASTKRKSKPEIAEPRTTRSATGDELIVITDEARKYLRPRTKAELETPTAKKRRAQAAAVIEAHGSLEAAMEKLADVEAAAAIALGEMLLLEEPSVRERCEQIAERLWKPGSDGASKFLLCFPHRSDWAAEQARLHLAAGTRHGYRDVLLTTLTDSDLLLELVKREGVAACIINVVPALRERAAAVLGEMFDVIRFPNEEKAVARALGCIGTAEAAAIFVQHLRKKNVRPYATEFFARFPHLAEPALGELSKKRTQVAEVARTILTSLERARSANEEASSTEDGEEVAIDELPDVLRAPPWTRKAASMRKWPTVPNIEVPRDPMRLHWSPRARRRWIATHWSSARTLHSDQETNKLESALANGEKAYVYANHPRALLLRVLAEPRENVHVWNETPAQALAQFGDAALEAVVEHHIDKLGDGVRMRVESPRIAAHLARKNLCGTWRRGEALHWVERYPEAAALGLIPVAIGVDEDEKTREGGAVGLRHLANLGHRAVIERAAKTYGPDALAAVEQLLASTDVHDGPTKPPKMPSTYRPEELRAPRLTNGKPLPRPAVEVLDQLLCAASLDTRSPGLAEVRAACEPRSLAEHAWDLAKAWDINGAKESHIWMLHAVAHLGDDEVVRRLTPALKGDGIAKMLGEIGTDAALMELITILVRVTRARNKKRPKYAWGTEAAIELIAARRGLDVDELEDHFVPTCDLDESGGRSLELGSRSYRVTFDPQLSRILLDETGARVAALPRGAKDDDPETVQAAAALLTDLEEDVAAIAELRSASLERAMIDGRTWALDNFTKVWANHPLMKHMARGVLWEARDAAGGRSAAFRVAEDGSFADVADDPFELPKDVAAIGVAHPVRFSKSDRESWRTLFGDYELLQPFDQLAREPGVFSAGELSGTSVTRPGVPSTDAIGDRLERGGWVHVSRRLHVLSFEDDTYLMLDVDTAATTASVVREGRPLPLSASSEVVRSELARALEIVAGQR